MQQQQKSVETAPRKISSDFFKEESKRIGQKMKVMTKKKFHCFNQTTTSDLSEVFGQRSELIPRTEIQSLFTD